MKQAGVGWKILRVRTWRACANGLVSVSRWSAACKPLAGGPGGTRGDQEVLLTFPHVVWLLGTQDSSPDWGFASGPGSGAAFSLEVFA